MTRFFDPDRDLPDPGYERPETCPVHRLDLDRRGRCFDCEVAKDDETRRLNEAMGIWEREE
jgi:hypothetical protein